MKTDAINPRTGIVVALCSIFLVFGFMFTMSGAKGEKLGDVPLLALGPAICIPIVVVVALASEMKGFTKWPFHCRCVQRPRDCIACHRSSPGSWDNGVWDNLAEMRCHRQACSGEDTASCTTTVIESCHLMRHVQLDDVLHYLQACYPGSAFLPAHDASGYCVFDRSCEPRDSVAYMAVHSSVVHVPRDSILAFSRRDSAPYGPYCCYINSRSSTWANET